MSDLDNAPEVDDEILEEKLREGAAALPSLNNPPGPTNVPKKRRFGPAPVTTEEKATIGFVVPVSLRDAIDDMKEELGMESVKGLMLTGLKNMGLDVPDEQIRVPKRRGRG